MILKILGCGTSTGVPIPGCDCRVCTSEDPKNERTRCSALLMTDHGENILIDASTDLRYQALKWQIKRVDAVLYTHGHADHILGTDDLRCFNFGTKKHIPCFGSSQTLKELRYFFTYIFDPDPNYKGGMLAKLSLHQIEEGTPITVCGIPIKPFALEHGDISVTGYRIGDVTYATDCKRIPERSQDIVRGSRVLILDGLRFRDHQTHMTITEAINFSSQLGVERTYLTHMTHDLDYEELKKQLPDNVEPAFDGLEIDVNLG